MKKQLVVPVNCPRCGQLCYFLKNQGVNQFSLLDTVDEPYPIHACLVVEGKAFWDREELTSLTEMECSTQKIGHELKLQTQVNDTRKVTVYHDDEKMPIGETYIPAVDKKKKKYYSGMILSTEKLESGETKALILADDVYKIEVRLPLAPGAFYAGMMLDLSKMVISSEGKMRLRRLNQISITKDLMEKERLEYYQLIFTGAELNQLEKSIKRLIDPRGEIANKVLNYIPLPNTEKEGKVIYNRRVDVISRPEITKALDEFSLAGSIKLSIEQKLLG